MADVKTLYRDTPREEFFYRQGFIDGYKAFRESKTDLTFPSPTERALEKVAENARSQVPDKPEVR